MFGLFAKDDDESVGRGRSDSMATGEIKAKHQRAGYLFKLPMSKCVDRSPSGWIAGWQAVCAW